MQAQLLDPSNAKAAEKAKLMIEKVYLDQVCKKIYQCYIDGALCYILHLNDELFSKQVCQYSLPPTVSLSECNLILLFHSLAQSK